MAYDGNGVFSFPFLWTNDASNGIPITASRMDTQFSNATQGFDLCVTRDNQGKPSASFLPDTDNAYDIGSALARWKGGFFSGALTVNGTVNNTNSASNAFTIATSNTAAFAELILIGGSGSSVGSSILFQQVGGTTNSSIGDHSNIIGGTSRNFTIQANTGNSVEIMSNAHTVADFMVQTDGSILSGTTTAGGWRGNFKGEFRANGNILSAYSLTDGFAMNARIDTLSAGVGSYVVFTYGNGGSPINTGSITTNGTTTTYGTTSDARLKTNIADSIDAGSIIDALRVRSWDWKQTGAHEAFGFVAQEEFAVYPSGVVQGDDNPEEIERQWVRDDSKLVPLLVKEIQSLRARLAAAGIA